MHRSLRPLVPCALYLAACSAWNHAPTDSRWLHPVPALSVKRAADAPLHRVVVYGDTRGDRVVHQRVAAAIAAEQPDVVIFTGDALECLPVGHMPDYGGWQYAIPFWPQYHRQYPVALLASLVPFPAALHDTAGTLVARPRDPLGFNAFLEDSASIRAAGATLLFVPGNHDVYHRVDRRALGALLDRPPDQLWYAVDRGAFRFVVLDTGTDLLGDTAAMPEDGPQLRWLEGVLVDAERRGLHAVVAVHHPPFSSGREEGSVPWVAERLVRGVLDRHRVALVLNGHAHAYERVERRDPSGRTVQFVVTGGGGAALFHEASARVAGSKAFVEGAWHYVLLEVSPSRILGRMVPVAIPERRAPVPEAVDAFEVALPPLEPARPAAQ